jgi:hypothetical protein
MIQEIKLIVDSYNFNENNDNIDDSKENIICKFCSKEFSSKVNLLQHQRTVKNCLKLQGKEDTDIECHICKKLFSIKYYNQTHKLKCTMSDKDIIIKLK